MPQQSDELKPSLRVTTEQQGRWLVVRLHGELAFGTCDELAQILDVPADGDAGPSIAVATAGLEFFDSTGLRCLLSAAKRVRGQGGEFIVLEDGRLARRIHWMSLTDILPVMAALPA